MLNIILFSLLSFITIQGDSERRPVNVHDLNVTVSRFTVTSSKSGSQTEVEFNVDPVSMPELKRRLTKAGLSEPGPYSLILHKGSFKVILKGKASSGSPKMRVDLSSVCTRQSVIDLGIGGPDIIVQLSGSRSVEDVTKAVNKWSRLPEKRLADYSKWFGHGPGRVVLSVLCAKVRPEDPTQTIVNVWVFDK